MSNTLDTNNDLTQQFQNLDIIHSKTPHRAFGLVHNAIKTPLRNITIASATKPARRNVFADEGSSSFQVFEEDNFKEEPIEIASRMERKQDVFEVIEDPHESIELQEECFEIGASSFCDDVIEPVTLLETPYSQIIKNDIQDMIQLYEKKFVTLGGDYPVSGSVSPNMFDNVEDFDLEELDNWLPDRLDAELEQLRIAVAEDVADEETEA